MRLPECANHKVRSRNAKPKAHKPAEIGCMWTGISFMRLIREGSPVSVPWRCGWFPCCGGRGEHDKTMPLTGTQSEKKLASNLSFVWSTHGSVLLCGPTQVSCISFFFLWTKFACLLSHIACKEAITVADQRIQWNKREQTALQIQNKGLCWDSEHDVGILP